VQQCWLAATFTWSCKDVVACLPGREGGGRRHAEGKASPPPLGCLSETNETQQRPESGAEGTEMQWEVCAKFALFLGVPGTCGCGCTLRRPRWEGEAAKGIWAGETRRPYTPAKVRMGLGKARKKGRINTPQTPCTLSFAFIPFLLNMYTHTVSHTQCLPGCCASSFYFHLPLQQRPRSLGQSSFVSFFSLRLLAPPRRLSPASWSSSATLPSLPSLFRQHHRSRLTLHGVAAGAAAGADAAGGSRPLL